METQAHTYDLTLEDCLVRAFRSNPAIRRLRADVERAAGDKIVFSSRALPQLAGQVQAGFQNGSLYEPGGLLGVVTADLSQPLIDVGIPPTLRRARLEVIIAQQNLHREVTSQLHQVRSTFLRALYFRDLIALYAEIDQRLQGNSDNEQRRFDLGTGSRSAVTSARIQKLNLQRDLANLRGEYFAAVTRLAELCGEHLSETTNGTAQVRLPNPVGALSDRPVTPDWQQASAYALEHRADVRLLRALAEAVAADAQTVRAGYFPFVALTASGLFIPGNELLTRDTQIVPGQASLASEVRAGVALSWQVIDNGRVAGQSRRLEAVRAEYEITLRQLEQNVPRELARIAGALQNASARLDALHKSADEAEENLKLIEARISLGEAAQYDFLRAQSDWLFVRSGLVEATYQQEAARAELDRATGLYLQFHSETAR